MNSEVLIKGSGISTTLDYIKSRFGQNALDQVLAAMPDSSRQSVTSAVVTGWYPIEHIGDLIDAIKMTVGKGDPYFIYIATTEAAKTTFNFIYKVLFKFGSPAYCIGKVASIWSTMLNRGTLTVVEQSDNHVILRLYNFPYKNRDYCGERLRGWFRAPLELSGCRLTKSIHSACTSRGDDYCEWQYCWM
jgi:hypothetical protein